MNSQATAGRIVHYTDATGRATAAIVCVDAALGGLAALVTFFPDTIPVSMKAVPYSEEPAKGCWSWMPYQKAKAEVAGGNQSESAEPRPVADILDTVKMHLNNLNERVEALEVGPESVTLNDLERRVEVLEDIRVAAKKEALAAAAADPSAGEFPPLRSTVRGPDKTTEPYKNTRTVDQSGGDAAETRVVTEPGPAAPDEAQDGQEVPEAAPDDAGR